MIALSVVACGDDTDDFWGSAVWRTSSTVGAAEGSAAIQIEGPVGAGWRAAGALAQPAAQQGAARPRGAGECGDGGYSLCARCGAGQGRGA